MFNWIKGYLKSNCIKWTINLVKSSLVAYISYYILKLLTGVSLLNAFWNTYENYYLSSYVLIQVLVGAVFYEGLGLLIELYLNYWIRKNEKEISVEIEKGDKKEITKFMRFIFGVIVFLEIIPVSELDKLKSLDKDEAKHQKNWEHTILIIKGACGFVVLGFSTAFIVWKADALYWIGGIILFTLVFCSIVVLMAYHFVIRNLDLINAFIQGYNTSARHLKKTNTML